MAYDVKPSGSSTVAKSSILVSKYENYPFSFFQNNVVIHDP